MFDIPTLADLTERARRAFRTYLPGSDAWLWPNNINPSAKVLAGLTFEVFGFASYIARMIFVHTAPDIETLKLHAADYGMSQRPAYPASGMIVLTSTGDLTVAAGAVFRRSDGVQYIAASAVSRAGAGILEVAVSALTDGLAGNAESGTPLAIVSGVVGGATAEVSGNIVGGADVEDIETFRARILFRKRYPPHGGAASDYVMWATDVVGVTRVFVEPLWAGAGTVRVFVLMDDLYQDGIPPTDAVARVADAIEALRPAGAIVTVAAPARRVIDVQISGLTPDTSAVREAALTALREAFARLSRVAGGATPHGGMPFLATPATFSRSWLWQAVANAAGEESHTIALPVTDVVLNAGEVPVLGTVTFV